MTKIVFTSCMDAERVPVQPVWEQIRNENPDVLMLLGDQIYMDWGDLGGSEWRKLIKRKPEKGLLAFATEMHRRYALQWEVPSFQALICNFAGRSEPSRLLVTWDDHDYAWNNSLGVDEADDHGVPVVVKNVSRRLFGQFLQQLRFAASGDPYPGLPEDWNASLDEGVASNLFWQGTLNGASGPECLLLDTRWHRQARAKGATLLGAAQRLALTAAVSRAGAGLLVVAAGTPMDYDYRFSQQAWRDPHGVAYVEYDETLRNALRPVLFLGGDVHRNVWSGRLRHTDGTSGRVVQVLSSGAAIGRIGPKRFAPSYGVVDVPAMWAHGGEVGVQLWAQSRGDVWQSAPPVTPLPFNASDWADSLHGQAESLVDATADSEPLAVLCARSRDGEYRVDRVHGVVENLAGIKGLDAVFNSAPQTGGSYPETLALAVGVAGDGRFKAQLQFTGDLHSGAERTTELEALMATAFARARDNGKKSVVLFIHGFGKSFEASLAQAYGLRQAFPECEPILYSWEAGRAGGVIAALTGVSAAKNSAIAGSFGMSAVLAAFGAASADGLAKVIVARSAGSVAMCQALLEGAPNFNGRLDSVHRIILSAPLLKLRDYNADNSFATLTVPVVVTRNRNDQTLKFADWIDGFGPMLGLDEGFAGTLPDHICLDFTSSSRVGQLHDYLFLKINPVQTEINRRLLTERVFDPELAIKAHLLQAGGAGAGVFHVL